MLYFSVPLKEQVDPPPEVSDYAQEPDGELCTRGSNVTATLIQAIPSAKTTVMGQIQPAHSASAYRFSLLQPISCIFWRDGRPC